jgi:hypothetical protein
VHLYRRLVAGQSTGVPRGRIVPIGVRAQEAAARLPKPLVWPEPGKDGAAALFDPAFDGTIERLVRLAGLGRFPMNADQHCRWCRFLDACRKSHPPSETRVLESPGYADYFELKSRQQKDLAGKPDGAGS